MDPKPHVRVWDIPIRLFHWSVVVLLCVSFVYHRQMEAKNAEMAD